VTTSDAGRRPRLEDVGVDAGVSAATVSLVLRGMAGPSAETRERVLEAAGRLGYRPDRLARALASGRRRTVGVLMDITSPFHGPLVLDLYDAAESHGYNVVLSTINRTADESRAIEALLDSRCEALVLLGPEGSRQYLNRLDSQVPVVVVGRSVPSSTVDVVRSADDHGVAQAVGHLVELGHHRIAYVGGPHGTVTTLRRTGYENAMTDAGLADRIRVIDGGLTEADGVRAAESLLGAGERPTGLITFNDRCGIGVIDALVREGIDVPGSVSVVGFDDSPVAGLPQINLTTVAQDPRALAVNAMDSLIERLERNRRSRREVIVAPRLIVRGTTGPCSNADLAGLGKSGQ
jgi:DNA-binding LacI/PurR family transcriptional regulator